MEFVGTGRHRRKPEGGVNGKFTNQSSRWEASEMDHSPKGEAVAQPNQWRSWERPTWTGSPKGEQMGNLRMEPVGTARHRP
jgi:hypothetical protein